MKNIKSMLREMEEYSSSLDDEYAEHALTQLHYVIYAVDEIIGCLEDACMVLPPWYINRISKIHSDIECLHSYLEGKKRKTFSSMGVGSIGVAYEESVNEAKLDHNKPIIVTGDDPKGKKFTKKFKNMKNAEKWIDSDDADDHKIRSIINEDTIAERKDDPADKDDDASDDDRLAADKNIIMQLRRVADLPRGGTVTFKDNRSATIKQADAKKALRGFDKLVKGTDKERYQKLANKSYNDLKKILSVIREEDETNETKSYVVSVTVSKTDHNPGSSPVEKMNKKIRVTNTKDENDALAKAKKYYMKAGYDVHDYELVRESSQDADINVIKEAIKKKFNKSS